MFLLVVMMRYGLLGLWCIMLGGGMIVLLVRLLVRLSSLCRNVW